MFDGAGFRVKKCERMTRNLGLTLVLTVWFGSLLGQSLNDQYHSELTYRRTGMIILGSWAAVNIASGLTLRARNEGTQHYFHEMNALWNSVNLGIATLGYVAANKLNTPVSPVHLFSEQAKLDQTLLFNAGLDLAYIAGGLYLTERAKNSDKNSERFTGYGRSVIMQGGFLFAFDVIMVLVHQRIELPENLGVNFIAPAPNHLQLALTYQF